MIFMVALAFADAAGAQDWPWSDSSLPPVQRAQMALDQRTEQEKLSLVHGVIAAPWGGKPKPSGSIGSAVSVAGVPRLGIPALQETDAELGVANPGDVRPGDTATAMPSDLALASTWNPELARLQGQAVGAEARAKGYRSLRITTGAQNDAMRALARKFGAHLTFRHGESTGSIDLTKQNQADLASPGIPSTIDAAREIVNFNRAYWRMLLRMYGWGRAA